MLCYTDGSVREKHAPTKRLAMRKSSPQLQKTPLPNKSSSFKGIVLEVWAGWAVELADSQEELGGQAVALEARVAVWAD